MANSKPRSIDGSPDGSPLLGASRRPSADAPALGSAPAAALADPILRPHTSTSRPPILLASPHDHGPAHREEDASPPRAPQLHQPHQAEDEEPEGAGVAPEAEPWDSQASVELYGMGVGDLAPIRVLLADDHVVVRAGICSLLESLDGVEVVAQASNGHEALRLLDANAVDAASSGVAIDIAILDISMGGMNGLEAAAHITRRHSQTRVIMLSMHDSEEYVKQALRAGATGYLLKESGFNELEQALRTVARGEIYLSPVVSRHLALAYMGCSNASSSVSPGAGVPGSTSNAAGWDESVKSPARKPGTTASGGEAVVLTPRQQEILRLLAQGLSNGQIASRLSISIKTVETHRSQLMSRLGIFDIVGLVRYAIRHGFIEPL